MKGQIRGRRAPCLLGASGGFMLLSTYLAAVAQMAG